MNAMLVTAEDWYPGSWRRQPFSQLPTYANERLLKSVEARLASAAPVVAIGEAARLRSAMADLATACDPRLNREQALDLAAHVAALIG